MRFFCSLILLSGCGIKVDYRGQQNQVRAQIAKNDFKQARILTENKKFLENKKSILLKKLEQGTTAYYDGQNYIALRYFDDAYGIAENLYTTRLKSKFAAVIDENHDIYYGLDYELGMIRFFQSLLHYKIYLSGVYEFSEYFGENVVKIKQKNLTENERRTHLFSSRAAILNWNSLLSTQKNEGRLKNEQEELFFKLWGSFIHAQIGTRDDARIAIHLLGDAKKIVQRMQNSHISVGEIDEKITAIETQVNVKVVLFDDFIVQKQIQQFPFFDPNLGFVVSYETLEIIKPSKINEYFVKIQSLNGDIVLNKKMTIDSFVSGVAFDAIDNLKTSVNAKAHARVAAKVATYIALEIGGRGRDDSGTQLFLLAARVTMLNSISEQKIDTRQWLTLPSEILSVDAKLKPGKYELKLTKNNKPWSTKKFVVKEGFTLIDLKN